ncbi:putative solute-binding protein [Alloalcanivorax sp. C16-1]|uniref:putative solute-binding protein n=1 Tax=Alloalcanivorax sp. C16-1 TaxID=3390051 RepID=UPI0039705186
MKAKPLSTLLILVAALAGLLAAPAGADDRPLRERLADRREVDICIWDLVGRHGPIFTAAQDQTTRFLQYGIVVNLEPYTNEAVMVEELKAGRCDAALMTGMRARLFNQYTGTIDSIGGLPTQEHLRMLLKVLADPRSAPRMTQGEYVVLGVAPAGGAYIFVNDKRINTLGKAAGKKVAVLDYDPVQAEMVGDLGAAPVPTDIVHAPGLFNNGVVDVLAAPLAAYQLMELYKGLDPDGGIIDYPLAQITLQLVGHKDRVSPELAQITRELFFQSYDDFLGRVRQETKVVPQHWFVTIPEEDKREYEVMMREAREELRQRGYYSADMLTLQKKIRCKLDNTRAECSDIKR